jgi:hypothetical protein
MFHFGRLGKDTLILLSASTTKYISVFFTLLLLHKLQLSLLPTICLLVFVKNLLIRV